MLHVSTGSIVLSRIVFKLCEFVGQDKLLHESIERVIMGLRGGVKSPQMFPPVSRFFLFPAGGGDVGGMTIIIKGGRERNSELSNAHYFDFYWRLCT